MEKYYSWGGASDPNFQYKVYVKVCTPEMMNWCNMYNVLENDPFCRYYVSWKHISWHSNARPEIEFQFEQEKPAVLFALEFAGR